MSILPVIFYIVYLILYMTNMELMVNAEFYISNGQLEQLVPLVPTLIFGTLYSVLGLADTIIYILHLIKNDALAQKRVIWIILLVILAPFSLPVYWFRYMYNEYEY